MKRTLVALSIGAIGLAVALVFVRLSLDWSDSQPYEGETTERRYFAFMAIALLIFSTGVCSAVLTYRRMGKRRN
ncbi:hypothetical protein QBL02_13255 [Leucobacter sp. UT-8R-CII-1-4]|uniref:hypothetical protein n=1 Tax=Leucobacter sp. UT-8R-CII-1-4 TaxID=3040075 RepID=UPI0024A80F33|nr:hypothetical protein [Leucobacter sp. UT-8R-CII-1-4]MDI6024505.1 hypothetical protein [Leucobacter sp. UT-8R-CII-1-4]